MIEKEVVLVEVAKLTADDGFQERQSDVLKGTQSHEWFPIPLISNGHILLGESTVAQSIRMCKTHIYARVVQASMEAKQAARELDRTLGQDYNLLAFVAAVAADIKANEPVTTKGRKAPSPESMAQRRVARWVGTSQGAIRMIASRVKKRGQVPTSTPAKREWKLECYNFVPAPDLQERAARWREKMIAGDFAFRRAMAELGFLEKPTTLVEKCINGAKQYGAALRTALPYALCPWCKSTVAIMPVCVACASQGWVSKLKFDEAPEELKTRGWVSHMGEYLDMRTLRPAAEPFWQQKTQADFGERDHYYEEEEPPL